MRDFGVFKKSAARLLEKTDRLLEQAASFDQETVMEGLNENRFNGFYYLFDERIKEAESEGDPVAFERESYIFSFEFNGNDKVALKSQADESNFFVEGGVLRVKSRANIKLETFADIGIPIGPAGGVEIRAKHKNGGVINLGWSKTTDERPLRGFLVIDSGQQRFELGPRRFRTQSRCNGTCRRGFLRQLG